MAKKYNIKLLIPTTMLLLTMLLIGTVASATPDYKIEVPDRTQSADVTLGDGAIVQYIGDLDVTYGASGSGVFDPFVRLQGNANKTDFESGYNTDGSREFDTKGGTWTHAILLSEIPIIELGGELYWEFWADINDNDNTPLISLDEFELYTTGDENLTGYDFGANADKFYDFRDNNGEDAHILIKDVNQGSGRGDLRYLVPVDEVAENCNYGNPACTTYLVLYSEWGGYDGPETYEGDGDYGFDGGFEEWKVKIYPKLQVSKNIFGEYETPVTWDIDKEVDDEYDLFFGDTVTHGYTVTVTPTHGSPENAMIYGTITIIGDEDEDVYATLTDKFNGADAVISSCDTTMMDGKYLIPAMGTVTCDYSLDLGGGPVDGTNVARASFEVDGVGLAFEGSIDILAGDYEETLTGFVDINVTDSNLEGGPWTASGEFETPTSWSYNKVFSCSDTLGDYSDGKYSYTHVNTAEITETGDSDIATVKVNCYTPLVSKDAETSLTRTWHWDITKSPDGEYDLFRGDTRDHEFTVSVNKTAHTDSDWAVAGSIEVYNPAPIHADLTDLSDVISPAIPAEVVVDCGVTFPTTLAAGDTLNCTYSADLPDAATRSNTATVTLQNYDYDKDGVGTASGTSAFASDPVSVDFVPDADHVNHVNASVDVTDTNAAFGGTKTVSDDDSWSYEIEYACDADEGYYINTAKVFGDDDIELDSDTARVDIYCHALTVTKNAQTYLTRTYSWYIDKVVDEPGPHTLFSGESVVVTYSVEVGLDPGYPVDSDWAVAGGIAVHNPAPIDAYLTDLSDVISPAIPADVAVDCGVTFPTTLAAGGTLNCTYSVELPDAANRSNTATVTLQNYDYDKNAVGTASGTTDFVSPAVAVEFASPVITYKDDEVDVTDSYAGFLGTLSALTDTLPHTFTYSRTITAPDAFCGEFRIDNEAWYLTNDSGTSESAFAYVDINVPCEGCTPGFWQGGAGVQLWDEEPTDPQWTYVGAQPFYTEDIFNSIFSGPPIDSRLNGQTMFQIVSNEGGIANSAEKAARSMVAAYLNESAFSETFPADSLLALETMWYNAVAGGDAALEDFASFVGGWNSPDGGYCPLP